MKYLPGGAVGCCLAVLCCGARADTASEAALGDNPYRAIVARNAFRLKEPVPPPPPPTNAVVAETPKLDVKLAGLGEIGGVRYAYLVVPDAEHPGQFEYPALTDNPARGGGVRHRDGLEVKSIDLKAQTVRIVNGGIEATLDLKEDGVKNLAAAPAKPGAPGVPGAGVNARHAPVHSGAGIAPAANATTPMAEPLIFSKNPRRASGGVVEAAPGGAATAGNSTWNAVTRGGNTLLPAPVAGGNLPSRPLRTEAAVSQAPAPEVPVQQQYEVYLRQKQIADQLGVPIPPLPLIQAPVQQPPQ